MWLDVEQPDGTKLGDGPIVTLTDWTFTGALIRAGRSRLPCLKTTRAPNC